MNDKPNSRIKTHDDSSLCIDRWEQAIHVPEQRHRNPNPLTSPPPLQIIGRLTFLTSSLTTRLIQKNYANIVKFKSFLNNLY